MPERAGLASMEDENESQNVVHFIRSPLNFFIDSLGSLTWGVTVWAGAGGNTAGNTGRVGVGQMAGVTYGCETTLGIKEESAIRTCVPTLETDNNGVVLQPEAPGLNSKLEYGYKLGAGMV